MLFTAARVSRFHLDGPDRPVSSAGCSVPASIERRPFRLIDRLLSTRNQKSTIMQFVQLTVGITPESAKPLGNLLFSGWSARPRASPRVPGQPIYPPPNNPSKASYRPKIAQTVFPFWLLSASSNLVPYRSLQAPARQWRCYTSPTIPSYWLPKTSKTGSTTPRCHGMESNIRHETLPISQLDKGMARFKYWTMSTSSHL
jgi:hypothetical protein